MRQDQRRAFSLSRTFSLSLGAVGLPPSRSHPPHKGEGMQDALIDAIFAIFLVTSPHQVLFAISAVLIFASLMSRLFFVRGLTHKRGNGRRYL